MSWWIKGWGDPFSYKSGGILRNPSCLMWYVFPAFSKARPSINVVIHWLPPPQCSLKCNVDASVSPSLLCSFIGGVLRDHCGNFICMFLNRIAFMEINNAALLAIHWVKVTSSSERFNGSHVIIDSDSLNAFNWCNSVNKGPWNLFYPKLHSQINKS